MMRVKIICSTLKRHSNSFMAVTLWFSDVSYEVMERENIKVCLPEIAAELKKESVDIVIAFISERWNN